MTTLSQDFSRRLRFGGVFYSRVEGTELIIEDVVGVNLTGPIAERGLYVRNREGDTRLVPMSRKDVAAAFEFKKERDIKSKPYLFQNSIFFGNGTESNPYVDEVHRQVELAFELLSGLQQPSMSTDPAPTPESEAYEAGLEAERVAILRSILTALDGKHLLKDP